MKTLSRYLLMVVLAALLLLVAGCVPVNLSAGGMIVGQNYRLASGETLNNGLTVMGGNAVLEKGSVVNGDVAVIGGNLTIAGTVQGDVSVLGGNVALDNGSLVNGNVNNLGGNVQRAAGAEIKGQIYTPENGRVPAVVVPRVNTSPLADAARFLGNIFWNIFQAFALAALAVLVALFAPRPLERVATAARVQPLITGGTGLLTLIVTPMILVILAITILLIPVSVLAALAVGVGIIFGWIALGSLTGQKLAEWFKVTWSAPLSAGVGTLTLCLASSLISIIPCVGWVPPALAGFVGLGAVVLTRFGVMTYPAATPTAPLTPVASVQPPQPPDAGGL